MLMVDFRSLAWWYWLGCVLLLTAGKAFETTWGFLGAIALTIVQLIHFAMRERSLVAFPIQVRFGYLLLLLVSLPQAMQWLFWLPLIGTWAQVLFGYCLMARGVSLLPGNRRQSMSAALLWRTFFSAPVRGNILQGLPPMSASQRRQDDCMISDASR